MLINYLLPLLFSEYIALLWASDRQISLLLMMKSIEAPPPQRYFYHEKILHALCHHRSVSSNRSQSALSSIDSGRRRRQRRHVPRENILDGEENANLYNENDGRRFREEIFDQDREYRFPANRKLKNSKTWSVHLTSISLCFFSRWSIRWGSRLSHSSSFGSRRNSSGVWDSESVC